MAVEATSDRIADVLRAQAEARPDAPAILAPDEAALSYAQLMQWIERAAIELRAAGVRPTSRVAVMTRPGPENALTTLAVMCSAGCLPLSPETGADDLAISLREAGVDFILTDESTDRPEDRPEIPHGFRVLVVHRPREGRLGDLRITPLDRVVLPTLAAPLFNQSDAIALLLHTSGTTARPKRVPLSQRNVLFSARANARCFEIGPGDRCLNVLPLLHIGGLVHGLLSTLVSGGSVVCPRGFDAGRFFELVAAFNPTWYTGTPTIHLALLHFLDDYRRLAPGHCFRFLRSASAPMPLSLIERLEEAYGAPLIEGYGMTEAGRITCNPLPPGQRKPGSVGRAVALDVRVVNQEGFDLPVGQLGEVVVRGPSVTSGYLDDLEANTAAFRGGWFHTGDLGHFDADGYLFLSGRIKELVNRGGKKIAPREIEAALLGLPSVREAAAFGVPHASLGEDLMAAVVVAPGATVDGEVLRRELLTRLTRHKVPSAIVVVERLPRGHTGKVQRSDLQEALASSLSRPSDLFETAEEATIARVFGEVLEIGGVRRDDNFFLLGGDSLSAARVVARLERELGFEPALLGVHLIFEFPTVATLAAELARTRKEAPLDDELLARIASLTEEEVDRMLDDDSLLLP